MESADGTIWPLASSSERARWAAQAVKDYQHMARIIITRVATSQARDPLPAADLGARAGALRGDRTPGRLRTPTAWHDVLPA